MTSLLGRLSRLFPESVRLEDLFTESVARLFVRRPDLCLAWLKEAGLLPDGRAGRAESGRVRVSSQRRFVALDHHGKDSRPDLLIEALWPLPEEPDDGEVLADVVMVESKIGSQEESGQLRRYAEHLDAMAGFGGKTLLYVTRAYDPKVERALLDGLGENVRFKQLRWHDFYRFLQKTGEKDALLEEVMVFMEEQAMAASYRFSSTDLAALSGIPRAFELMEETLGGEVKAKLQSFAGNRSTHENIGRMLQNNVRYIIAAPLHKSGFSCYLGYRLRTSDGYPLAYVNLMTEPGAEKREVAIAAMNRIANREGWVGHKLDDPKAVAMARRMVSLASLLGEEDHIAAVKSFFVESIRELKEELTAFKKEHPELPWGGPNA